MRLHTYLLVGTSILFAAACQDRGSAPDTLSNDLKRDLEAAASSDGLQLANNATDYQRQRFVSDIEQTNRSAPSKDMPRPRPVVRSQVGTTSETVRAPAEEVAAQVVTPETPEPEPATQTPAADEPRVPIVAPRPVAAPVEAPGPTVGSGGGRGAGAPPEIGEVIGVIFRGGGVGDDHCVPNRRPGGRGFPFPRIFQSPGARLIVQAIRN